MPICSKCKDERPIERFARQTGKFARHKFYKICIDCQTKQIYDQQEGKCAICRIEATNDKLPGRWGVLYVDHNHMTKEVRGLLCLRCNSLLGFAQDSEDVLCAAINYLRKNGG